MERRLRGRSIHELNRDYLDLLARVEEEDGPDEDLLGRLRAYRRFIERNAHRIGPQPGALLAVAHAEPQDSPVRAEACRREADGLTPQGLWFRRLHPPPTDPNPALLRVLEGHTGGVYSVARSADGCHALSGSFDGTLRYWDLQRGQCLAVLEGHAERVYSVVLSADGRHALSGSLDRALRYWDLLTGQCLATLEAHTERVNSVALKGQPLDTFAFTNTKGGRLNRHPLYQVFVRCCRRAKIEIETLDADGQTVECVTLHSLRKTFATDLIARGADPKAVQELLGHATLAITWEPDCTGKHILCRRTRSAYSGRFCVVGAGTLVSAPEGTGSRRKPMPEAGKDRLPPHP